LNRAGGGSESLLRLKEVHAVAWACTTTVAMKFFTPAFNAGVVQGTEKEIAP
jgi:hypothetical protein